MVDRKLQRTGKKEDCSSMLRGLAIEIKKGHFMNKKLLTLTALSLLAGVQLDASSDDRGSNIVLAHGPAARRRAAKIKARQALVAAEVKKEQERQARTAQGQHNMAQRADAQKEKDFALAKPMEEFDCVHFLKTKFLEQHSGVGPLEATKLALEYFQEHQVGGKLQLQTKAQAQVVADRNRATYVDGALKAYKKYIPVYVKYHALNCSPWKLALKKGAKAAKKNKVKPGNKKGFLFIDIRDCKKILKRQLLGMDPAKLERVLDELAERAQGDEGIVALLDTVPSVDTDLPVMSFKKKAERGRLIDALEVEQTKLSTVFTDYIGELIDRTQ